MSRPNPYDELPYGSEAVFEMHPNRMAVVGRLFGLDPAPVRTCRVLEIGCAEGGNAIPVAVSLPEARVVGIDLSERQVAIGNERISALGLGNVELIQADLAELKGELGTFDYVCAHGVYSWIAPQLQGKLLRACRDLLSPDGVAYVSYNTYPGWSPRLVLREMALYRARRERGEVRRVAAARRLLESAAGAAVAAVSRGASVRGDPDGYRALLASEWSRAGEKPDGYIAHEYLEDENHPCWFHEFAAKAAASGLRYVADSVPGTMPVAAANPGLARALDGIAADPIEREQYADLLHNGAFRQSLLCRSERTPLGEPDLSILDRFHAVTYVRPENPPVDLAPGVPARFVSSGVATLETADPFLKAALALLAERSPEAVAVGELDPRLGRGLMLAYATKLVELLDHPPACAARPSERPVASPLARLQAARPSGPITTLHHRDARLTDPLARHVLARLDGTRDLEALARESAEVLASKGLMRDGEGKVVTDATRVRAMVDGAIGAVLEGLARSALLTA